MKYSTGRFTCFFSKFFLFILMLPGGVNVYSQLSGSLSIKEVYQLARKNYPLLKQKDLIEKTKEYSILNAEKGYLPVFSVNGQATYQSAVTSFPFKIPGTEFPQFSKDQYKFYAEANQVIYDGGIIKNRKQTAEASEVVQLQDLEVELYALYERVSQLFFGALLMDEQLKVNNLLQKNIQNGIDKSKALVANGVALRSSVDEFSAQLLQAQQARIEILSTRKAFTDMLSLFINTRINESVELEKPAAPPEAETISRPELLVFEYQKKISNLQGQLLKDQLKPKLSFFAQAGYGRPGLNFLSNDFSWYYAGGIRFNWNFGSLYSLKDQQHLLNISTKALDVQKETFLFNTKISGQQQKAIVEKYGSLLQIDDSIIDLRTSVKEAAYAQLENGALSSHDYLSFVNEEDQARRTQVVHEMQLLQAQYSYQNIMGHNGNE